MKRVGSLKRSRSFLLGYWFVDDKFDAENFEADGHPERHELVTEAVYWLGVWEETLEGCDYYFEGKTDREHED